MFRERFNSGNFWPSAVIEQKGILPSIEGGIINLFKTILLTWNKILWQLVSVPLNTPTQNVVEVTVKFYSFVIGSLDSGHLKLWERHLLKDRERAFSPSPWNWDFSIVLNVRPSIPSNCKEQYYMFWLEFLANVLWIK